MLFDISDLAEAGKGVSFVFLEKRDVAGLFGISRAASAN
jgi:hypothetical protein